MGEPGGGWIKPAGEALIIAVVKSSHPAVEPLITVLSKIGKPAVEPLITALEDESWILRWNAAEVLGMIKDPRAVEPLITALEDENVWVRGNAAEALGMITGKDFGRDPEKWQEWCERNKGTFLKNR